MTERATWVTLRKHLSPFGVLQRIESPTAEGIPDVCYCLSGVSGWLELKHTHLPMRERTKLSVRSLTYQQVTWHEAWAKAGGRAFTFLRIPLTGYALFNVEGTRWLLERRYTLADVINRDPGVLLYSKAFPLKELVTFLTT